MATNETNSDPCDDLRKRTEQELARARQDLQTLFNVVPELLATASLDGRLLSANPAWEQILGHSIQEIVGQPWESFVHPDDIIPTREAVTSQIQGCAVIKFQNRYRHKDGSYRWIEWNATPAIGDVLYAAGRDVTGRKRTEETLRESEERFRLVASKTPDHIIIQDCDLRYSLVINPQLGLTEKDIIGKTDHDFLRKEDAEKLTAVKKRVLETGKQILFATSLPNSQGGTEFFEGTYIPTFDATGKSTGLLGYFRNITDRKQTEQNQLRLLAILDATPDFVGFADARTTQILHINPAGRKMVGIGLQEDVNQFKIADVQPEWTSQLLREVILPTAIRDGVWTGECAFLHRDGREIPVLMVLLAHKSPDGEVERFSTISRDITNRKRTETALRETENKLRTIFEVAPEGILVADADSRDFIQANPAICRMLGYSEPELLQLSVNDIHPPEHLAHVIAQFNAEARGEISRACNVPCLRKDRSIFYADITSDLVTIAGRQTVVGFFSDITERKQTEEALRLSHELLSLHIRRSPIYAYIKTVTPTESRVVCASDNYQNMIGIPGSQMVGKTMEELFPPKYAAKFTADDWTVVSKGTVLQQDEDFNGRNYTTIKFPIVQGDKTLLAGYTIDITERKQLQAQLLQAQKLEAIGRLAGGVAHDFRNQLTIIRGCAEMLLRQGLIKDGQENIVTEILNATEHGTQLTGQLLSFSRKDMLQPSVVDLGKLVANLAGPIGRLVGEDIAVSTTGCPSDCQVNIATAQFQDALMNLAANARDAMPRGGKLTIDTACISVDRPLATRLPEAQVGRYARVTMRDTGIGMDPATQARLFEPFFTTKQPGQGTGLGLSMVYGFVRQSGGFITVESAPGKGTVIALHFPRVSPAVKPEVSVPNPVAPEPPPTIDLPNKSATVLVVEDQLLVRWLLIGGLREAGYTVIDTVNAKEAIEAADKPDANIDMLITDVVMPGMSGVDLAKHLRVRWPEIPVLFVSAYSANDLAQRGVDLARAELLVKPFGHAKLVQTVRRLLEPRV